VAAIRLLVDGGADVNSANERGETALHCAAENGHVSAILALKELGANMDVRNEEQKTALEVAAANGHAHVLNHRGVWAAPRPDLLGVSAPRIAVAPAADVHWADTNQRRLRNRARAGDLEGIRELLAIGVDLVGNGSTDEEGKSAWQLAEGAGHSRIALLLEEAAADQRHDRERPYGSAPFAAPASLAPSFAQPQRG